MIRYIIVGDEDMCLFEKQVEYHIQEGWKCQGGLTTTIINDYYDVYYEQAMIKEFQEIN